MQHDDVTMQEAIEADVGKGMSHSRMLLGLEAHAVPESFAQSEAYAAQWC